MMSSPPKEDDPPAPPVTAMTKPDPVPPIQRYTIDLRTLNLDEENTLRAVLEKDAKETDILDDKVGTLRREINELRKRGALAEGDNQNTLCARCKYKFWLIPFPFTNKSKRCIKCKFRVCQKCRTKQINNTWLCSLCLRQREEQMLSGMWMIKGHCTGIHGSELIRASLRDKELWLEHVKTQPDKPGAADSTKEKGKKDKKDKKKHKKRESTAPTDPSDPDSGDDSDGGKKKKKKKKRKSRSSKGDKSDSNDGASDGSKKKKKKKKGSKSKKKGKNDNNANQDSSSTDMWSESVPSTASSHSAAKDTNHANANPYIRDHHHHRHLMHHRNRNTGIRPSAKETIVLQSIRQRRDREEKEEHEEEYTERPPSPPSFVQSEAGRRCLAAAMAMSDGDDEESCRKSSIRRRQVRWPRNNNNGALLSWHKQSRFGVQARGIRLALKSYGIFSHLGLNKKKSAANGGNQTGALPHGPSRKPKGGHRQKHLKLTANNLLKLGRTKEKDQKKEDLPRRGDKTHRATFNGLMHTKPPKMSRKALGDKQNCRDLKRDPSVPTRGRVAHIRGHQLWRGGDGISLTRTNSHDSPWRRGVNIPSKVRSDHFFHSDDQTDVNVNFQPRHVPRDRKRKSDQRSHSSANEELDKARLIAKYKEITLAASSKTNIKDKERETDRSPMNKLHEVTMAARAQKNSKQRRKKNSESSDHHGSKEEHLSRRGSREHGKKGSKEDRKHRHKARRSRRKEKESSRARSSPSPPAPLPPCPPCPPCDSPPLPKDLISMETQTPKPKFWPTFIKLFCPFCK